MSIETKNLTEIPVGELFKIGRFEFVKFADENGKVTAVSKNSLFDSKFGKNNDFSKSEVLKRLTNEILPEIEKEVGRENVLEFETDLLSLDGSSKHGVMRSRIGLPTFDFYRKHRAIFEKHKLDKWWWLATPDGTSEYNNDNWVVCVAPSGNFRINRNYSITNGVRPFCIFNSNIFVSCEER